MVSTPADADYVDRSYLLNKDEIKLVTVTCDVKNRRLMKAGRISWSAVKQSAGGDNAASLPIGADRLPKALTVSERPNGSQPLHAACRCETVSRTAKALRATLKTIRSQQTPGSADGAPRRLPRRVGSAKAGSDRTSWSLDRIRGKGLACLAQAITRNRSWRTVIGAPGSGQPSSLGQADGPATA